MFGTPPRDEKRSQSDLDYTIATRHTSSRRVGRAEATYLCSPGDLNKVFRHVCQKRHACEKCTGEGFVDEKLRTRNRGHCIRDCCSSFRVTALDFSWRARSCRDMDKGWPHLDVLVHRHGIPGSLLVAQSSDDLMTAHTPKMYRPTSCHSKEKHQKWSPKDDPCVN